MKAARILLLMSARCVVVDSMAQIE